MLFLIFGQDQFRVQEKLNQLKEKFTSIAGNDFNIKIMSAEMTFQQIQSEIQYSDLLSPQKMIILKNFLKEGAKEDQKKLAKYIIKVPKEVWLVFIEEKIKENTIIVKKIREQGKVWELESLSYYNVQNWIKERITKSGGKITPEAVQTLTFYVGSNLVRMATEIEKLVTYKGRAQITIQDVEILVKPEFLVGIFDLIDNLAAKNLKKSQKLLFQMLIAGENPIYIHTMIVYQFRNLILLKALSESNLSPAEIRTKTGLHPFVIQKSQPQLANFSLLDLKKIYAKLLDAEVAMKTGKIEPSLALQLLVVALQG